MHSEKWSSVSSLQSGGSRFVEDAESAKLSHSCTLESLEEQKLQTPARVRVERKFLLLDRANFGNRETARGRSVDSTRSLAARVLRFPAQQRVLSTGAQSVRDQRTAASQAPRAFGSNNWPPCALVLHSR
jgi:hypothetical protein